VEAGPRRLAPLLLRRAGAGDSEFAVAVAVGAGAGAGELAAATAAADSNSMPPEDTLRLGGPESELVMLVRPTSAANFSTAAGAFARSEPAVAKVKLQEVSLAGGLSACPAPAERPTSMVPAKPALTPFGA